jgi:phosphoribosylformylglycinamidine synthase
LTAACNELGTPITGGNVSFYNETLGKSIYPTPVIGMLGMIEDASQVLRMAFREEGDVVVLLDGSAPVAGSQHVPEPRRAAPLQGNQSSAPAQEFSSSEYSKTIGGIVAGEPPAVDLAAEKHLQNCLVALAAADAVQSAHDVSDGGLTVAIAESCFASSPVGAQPIEAQNKHAAPHLGANVSLQADSPAEHALFGERGARAVVSVKPTSLARVLDTARQYGVGAREIGEVTRGSTFRIQYNGRAVVDSSVQTLRDAWANSLERALEVQ